MSDLDTLMHDCLRCACQQDVTVAVHRHPRSIGPAHIGILLVIHAQDHSSITLPLDALRAAAIAEQLDHTDAILHAASAMFSAYAEFERTDAERIADALRKAVTLTANTLIADAAARRGVVEPDA